MAIRINGKIVSKEEALKWVQDPEVVVTNMSVEYHSNPNREKSLLSHEGFGIDRGLIQEMSERMTDSRAGIQKLSISRSPKIMNRDFYMLMVDPNYLPWWKKLFLEHLL